MPRLPSLGVLRATVFCRGVEGGGIPMKIAMFSALTLSSGPRAVTQLMSGT